MPAYTKRGYGPPKPAVTASKEQTLDRFGMALVGEYILSTNYSDDIPGLPINLNQSVGTNNLNITTKYARSSLLGMPSPLNGEGALPDVSQAALYNIGCRIIHLAQCVREAGLCSEYLIYSTLPADNDSGIFDAALVSGQTKYVGDVKAIYDETVATLPYTASMFTLEDREQYDNHPLIPVRLAYYIKAFMDTLYKDKRP